MMVRPAGFLGLFLLASVHNVNAASIAAVPVGSTGETLVSISGDLTSDDFEQFKQATVTTPKAMVVLSSNGGSLLAGIEIGRLIRQRKFATLVPDSFRCASACALAWLGGTQRYMGLDAQVGFHAAFDAVSGKESGVANALVGAYLTQIGLPEGAVFYITQAPPDSMTWLTRSDAEKVGIVINDMATGNPAQNEDQWTPFNLRLGDTTDAKTGRFIEFTYADGSTNILDLSSVREIMPGRFSVVGTTLDKPEITKLKLSVHDALSSYCARSDGSYEPSSDILLLGHPDLSVEKVKVEGTNGAHGKFVFWSLPYKRFAQRRNGGGWDEASQSVSCPGYASRSQILNGRKSKELYDCNRGTWGIFAGEPDDASARPITMQMASDSGEGLLRRYVRVCLKLTGHAPYMPPE